MRSLLRKYFSLAAIAFFIVPALMLSAAGKPSAKTSIPKEAELKLSDKNAKLGSQNFIGNTVGQNDKKNKGSSSQTSTSGTAAGDWGAIAGFGEIGPRNLRGSGTYGVYFTPTSRFKISGEYLTQNLNFNFNSGYRNKWVSQLGVGAEYQYLFDCSWMMSFELGTAYSHAFSRHLSKEEITNGFVKRHIADSNGSLSFLGATTRLWNCAFLSVAADYDWISFDRKYEHDKTSNGFGGSVDFVQQFAKDFSLNLGAQWRQPFNSYQGLLNWNHRFSCVNLDVGVFGNLTEGHDGVRDIRTVGVQLGLAFGPKSKSCGRSPDMSSSGKGCYVRQYCDVSQWAATPAIYVPVVLTIADQEEILAQSGIPCTPPISIDVVPPIAIIHHLEVQIFNVTITGGTPGTYTVAPSAPLTGGATFTQVNGGFFTVTGGTAVQTVTFIVTFTNSCGSVIATVPVNFSG